MLRSEQWSSLLPELRRQLSEASPFPHASLDGLFDEDLLLETSAAFPSLPAQSPGKAQWAERSGFPPPLQRLCETLLGNGFVGWLRAASGLGQLVSDPDDVWGTARIAAPGTGLAPHLGSGQHPRRPLVRKYTLVTYLTPAWSAADEGELELWDATVSRTMVKILPLFNRLVLFETGPVSFHGVAPVAPSSRRLRRSLSVYFYLPEPSP